MSLLEFIIFLSFSPAIFLLYIFYKRDKERPEPQNIVIKIFIGGGILTAFLAGMLNDFLLKLLFGTSKIEKIIFNNFLTALKAGVIPGVVEEVLKFIAILIFAYKIKEFDERADGIVYALCVGMGFAAIENFFYVLENVGFAVLRALTAVPLHAILAVLMGYFLGEAKFSKSKKALFFFLALFFPITLHTFYDAMVFYSGNNDLFSLVLLLATIIFAILGIIFSFKIMGEQVREDKMLISLENLKIITKIQNLKKERELRRLSALENLKKQVQKEKDTNQLS